MTETDGVFFETKIKSLASWQAEGYQQINASSIALVCYSTIKYWATDTEMTTWQGPDKPSTADVVSQKHSIKHSPYNNRWTLQ